MIVYSVHSTYFIHFVVYKYTYSSFSFSCYLAVPGCTHVCGDSNTYVRYTKHFLLVPSLRISYAILFCPFFSFITIFIILCAVYNWEHTWWTVVVVIRQIFEKKQAMVRRAIKLLQQFKTAATCSTQMNERMREKQRKINNFIHIYTHIIMMAAVKQLQY